MDMRRVGVLVLALGLAAFGQDRGRGGLEDGLGPNGRGVMGTVTAVTAESLEVKTADGEAWKVVIGPNTRVLHEQDPARLGDIKPGYGVMAFGQPDKSTPNTLHALFTNYQTAAEVKARMANFGKTWIGGKVTAIDGTRITVTVQRPGESAANNATFQVDETTSFHKGREEVTLADVKAGDYVMGKGGMKNGIFIPTELTVRTPGERRHGPPPAAAPAEEK